MKRLFATALVALTIGTSAATFAAANPAPDKGQTGQPSPASVSIEQIEKSKIDVVIEKQADTRTIIRLLDASGRSLATKTLQKDQEATRVRFNLASLKDGFYFVKVMNGRDTQVTKFELETSVPADSYQMLTIR